MSTPREAVEKVIMAISKLRSANLDYRTLHVDFQTYLNVIAFSNGGHITHPKTFHLFGSKLIYDEELLQWPCVCGIILRDHGGKDCLSPSGLYYPMDNLKYVSWLAEKHEPIPS
jgi:hypothetical protein